MVDAVSNMHMHVRVDHQRRRVSVTRSSVRFASVEDVHSSMAEVVRALAELDRSRMTLLVDLRAGPMRNDPAFEGAMSEYRRQTERGFQRVVFLVRSAVGELQLQRLAQEVGGPVHVTRDEADAVRFLDA